MWKVSPNLSFFLNLTRVKKLQGKILKGVFNGKVYHHNSYTTLKMFTQKISESDDMGPNEIR